MTIIQRLEEISRRLSHLDEQGLWIARETVNSDTAVSQSGTLICALAADLQEKLADIIAEIEEEPDDLDDVTPYH